MKLKLVYSLFFLLLLLACNPSFVKLKEEVNHFTIKESKESDRANKIISAYKANLDSETQKVIAIASDVLTKDKDQNPLGNFVCDALNFVGQKQFLSEEINLIIVNRGGLRNNLPKGEIRVLNIFELMPFDNEMVLVQIKGDKLLDGLKTILEKKHSFFGIELTVKNGVIIESSINGNPIDKSKTYSVVTSDYIANGGDSFNFLKNPIAIRASGTKIRDAIIEYCIELNKNGKQIIPYTDERLKISK